jgi:uncharacterized protein YndB with AHSA1/START domain
VKWFCPAPWKVVECDIELQPGGRFFTVMQGPDGERHAGEGFYLEVVPQERLVWTNALLPGYRPAPEDSLGLPFTAILTFDELGSDRTRYSALLKHRDSNGRDKHDAMGFAQGWNTALDQLIAIAKTFD